MSIQRAGNWRVDTAVVSVPIWRHEWTRSDEAKIDTAVVWTTRVDYRMLHLQALTTKEYWLVPIYTVDEPIAWELRPLVAWCTRTHFDWLIQFHKRAEFTSICTLLLLVNYGVFSLLVVMSYWSRGLGEETVVRGSLKTSSDVYIIGWSDFASIPLVINICMLS